MAKLGNIGNRKYYVVRTVGDEVSQNKKNGKKAKKNHTPKHPENSLWFCLCAFFFTSR